MTKTTKKAMNTMMTAACAGAAFCCACAASHTVILSVLGAIIMASIILRSGAGTAGTGRLCTYAIGTDTRMTR